MPRCKRYSPRQLSPVVNSLVSIFHKNLSISGVAVAGSLARLEPLVHDIDLVIFHRGSREGLDSCNGDDLRGSNISSENEIIQEISRVRQDIPVNYIFVHEKILWNCNYLQSFSAAVEGDTESGELYPTVFCEVPLLWIELEVSCNTTLRAYAREYIEDSVFGNHVWRIAHTCGDSKCRSRRPWEERRKDLKKKKGHTWHE